MSNLDTCTNCGHEYDAIRHHAKGKPSATCFFCYIEMLAAVLESMQVAAHVAFQATYGTPNHSTSQAKYRRMISRLSDRIAMLKAKHNV